MKISTDERFRNCLEHLAQKFNGKIKICDKRYVLNLKPCIDHYQVFDCIVEQIVTAMKAFYLESKLKIKNKTLIKVLVNYDKKSDIIIAASLFNLTPETLLDSIYDFRLSRLKFRWNEVIQLVNENYPQLTQKVVFNELLRFLIINMDYRMSEAHIITVNKHPQICDKKLNPLPHTDEDIINSLIDIAPRQIVIHTDNYLNKEVIDRIENFFPNCICIEYNAVL